MGEDRSRVELLRGLYKTWGDSKGGTNPFIDHLDDAVCWNSLADGAPGLEFTRCGSRKDDVIRYFQELGKDWSMNYYIVDDFIADGDKVVALCRISWTNKVTGKTATSRKADVMTFKNDRIVDFVEFYDTAAAVAAAQPG